MAQDEYGHCPQCGLSLRGGSIWTHFQTEKLREALAAGKSNQDAQQWADGEADRISAMYGASRQQGCWGVAVALYDRDKDRTVQFMCPECKHTWDR